MKYYGINSGGVIFAEIEGKIWEGSQDIECNPEKPCDCCVPNWMKDETEKDGILLWRKDRPEKNPAFYHNGSIPPSQEEWLEILILHESALKVKAAADAKKKEEDKMWHLRRNAIGLIEKLRLADCEVFCRVAGIDFEQLCKQNMEDLAKWRN